jgi:hypothetical protein
MKQVNAARTYFTLSGGELKGRVRHGLTSHKI